MTNGAEFEQTSSCASRLTILFHILIDRYSSQINTTFHSKERTESHTLSFSFLFSFPFSPPPLNPAAGFIRLLFVSDQGVSAPPQCGCKPIIPPETEPKLEAELITVALTSHSAVTPAQAHATTQAAHSETHDHAAKRQTFPQPQLWSRRCLGQRRQLCRFGRRKLDQVAMTMRMALRGMIPIQP